MFGIFRKCAGLALLVLCLVVATAAAQAQATGGFRIGVEPIVTTFTSARFVVTTPVATRLTIATGTDRNNLISTPDRLKFRHVVNVRGLAPNTNYYALITATPKTGKAVKTWRTFKTAAPGSVPATMTIVNDRLLLNGAPFFPIMAVMDDCPDLATVLANVRLGVNAFWTGLVGCGGNVDPTDPIKPVREPVAGKVWLYDNRLSPSQLPELLVPVQAPVLFRYQGLGDCNPQPGDLESLGLVFRYLFGHKKPLLYNVYLADRYGPDRPACFTAQQLQAVFWTIVVAGGSGLVYKTIYPWDFSSGAHVPPMLAAQAAKLAAQMATVGPAVLSGKPVVVGSDPKSPVRVGAWRYGGATYVLAVNTSGTSVATANISVPGKVPGIAQVLFENRTIRNQTGSVTDRFDRLGVHWYKFVPAGPKKK